MDDKKIFKKAKRLFDSLKTDPASIIFAEEFLDNRLLKKLERSTYTVDKQLYKLVNFADSKNFLDDGKLPTRADYVEKREIDRLMLYSFDDDDDPVMRGRGVSIIITYASTYSTVIVTYFTPAFLCHFFSVPIVY